MDKRLQVYEMWPSHGYCSSSKARSVYNEWQTTEVHSEGMSMLWRCVACESTNVRRRSRTRDYRCETCGHVHETAPIGKSIKPWAGRKSILEPGVPRKLKDVLVPHGPEVVPGEVQRRLEHIRETHAANPDYGKKDLRMVCFETDWMVNRYWKENISKVAMIKTN